ncbi:hypothetical protein GCM10010435_41340 [Winogradskya consettensis]|uniref:Uncharacterized protein n=1 Tax=Winogradskya consettensis TaxID=113560 RepID=A0A919SR24_9ACTN|nr:hypothetical protein [Actinoplanes consettensis]GIM76861.1 hypothetical protein Aco04nite_52540 [Actinoplanes consettensis]
MVVLLPLLRGEGWFLTPFNTSVSEAGEVVLLFRPDDRDLGQALVQRLSELAPGLAVVVKLSAAARHVIFRL